MAYNLTMTSAAYNASGKFGQSLNGGYGLANGVLSGTKISVEAVVKGSTNGSTQVAAGQGNCLWMGMDSNGNALAHYGGAGGAQDVTLQTSVNIADGAYHHLSLDVDSAAGGTLYVDGVAKASSTTAGSFDFTSSVGNFGVRIFPYGNGANAYQTGFGWAGDIDEVAIYSGIKRTANFTPPTAATSNTDANLLALYHLDGNGTDSATVPATVTSVSVSPSNPTVQGGATQQFSATVSGTGSPAQGVTWSLSGSGSISASGLYTAPAATSAAQSATVTATSTADTTKSGTSSVTVPAAAAQAVNVAYNDPSVLYSPYNWDDRSSYIVTAAAGAYLKLGFTGTSVSFGVDVSALSGASIAAGSYPIVRTIIDGLQAVDTPLTASTTSVSRSGLASGSHTVELILLATDDSAGDLWNTPTNALRITGITLDSGATASKPAARSKNAIMFGDSIWRGYMANGTTTTQPGSNNAAASALPMIARAFDCEFGAVAYSGQGYEQTGNANVVPFPQAYGSYSSGRSRLVSGKFSPAPDFIFVEHGTNGSTTSSDVQTMIANLRAAAPSAKIIQMIPVGGFNRSNITSGVSAAADANTFLIDLGTTFQTGLTSYGSGPNVLSIDGLHPNLLANSRIAAAYCAKTQAALDGAAAPVTNARTFSVTLGDATGALASLTGLSVAFYDQSTPGSSAAPVYKTETGTTNASGVLTATVQSTLASGGTGRVEIRSASGQHYNGPVQVS